MPSASCRSLTAAVTNVQLFKPVVDPYIVFFFFSVFYVFYEQYLTIVGNTAMNLSICMVAIFVVTFVLLGFDLTSAVLAFIVISMIIIDIMGMMWMWNIDLNALSLVNLVMVSLSFFLSFFGREGDILATSRENMYSGVLIRYDLNQHAQLQRQARVLKFRL